MTDIEDVTEIIRLGLDFGLVKHQGDAEVVAQAVYKLREKIGQMVTAVLLQELEETSEMKIVIVAGSSHVHNNEAEGGRCSECVRYSGRKTLTKVASISG